jgi:cytochrome c peroxidase
LFDTLNDDSYGNPKITPTLRNVTKTGPWTWHGWKESLSAAVEDSITETLFGNKPTAEDVKSVIAYMETLDHPPAPKASAAAKASADRGKLLFESKAGCARCHAGADYTTSKTYTLDIEADGSPFDRWNPPSLRGVRDRSPLMHAAQAPDLDALLRLYHKPEDLGGKALDAAERADLIAFLKSLD